jgi:hypothetical protein
MIRIVLFALLTTGVLSVSSARAELPVAPPPREVHADGSRDPVPQPELVKKEDPRVVVDRIIKNSEAVGDKLAKTDTGPDTQTTQTKILKDIDALLNQDNPPPKPDQNQDKDKNKDMNPDMNPDMSKDKKDMKDMSKGSGQGDMNPMPKGNMGGTGMESAGGDQPRERRPRQQGADQKDQQPKEQGSGGGSGQQKTQPANPKDSKNSGGQRPDPDNNKNSPPGKPILPLEADVVKQVWGHLPDKLRQQATQYYQEEFMPRYAELLKQYYSSLSEKK